MRVVVIGVGNAERSDDAAGLLVVRSLVLPPDSPVRIYETHGEGTTVMEAWQDADVAILVDAVHSGAEPGSLHRFEAQEHEIPRHFLHASTHTFGVAEAIELARALRQLPPCLIVYGIEAASFTVGGTVSSVVQQTIKDTVQLIQLDLQALFPARSD